MNKKLLDYFNQDELAASVWLGKYAVEGEESPDDTHRRMSKEFWRVEKKYQDEETKTNPPWEENKKQLLSKYGRGRANLTEEAIYNLFKDFKYIVPQGRVMAGLGVKDSYRSLSNCLRLPSPNDSYSSIMYVDTLLVNAAKRGMGFGLGLSKLRPKGLSVTNAAKTTTGIIPFMERFSNSTREVGQDSRRGASLQDIDIRHPDSLDFITSKKDLTKITGSNISVFMPDDFMRAVENDEDYILRFPCDFNPHDFVNVDSYPYNELKDVSFSTDVGNFTGYIKKIKAREYFNTLIETIKVSSEPGVFFRDTMTDYSPSNVYEEYFELGTNACFAYGTKILTAEGYKKIGELEGQELDFINSIGEIVLGTVFKSGERAIFTLHLSDGTKLKTTIDHIFMLTDGTEKEAQFITTEDRLMPFYSINEDYTEFVKYGFIQGDGQTGRLDSESHLGLEVNIGKDDVDIAKIFNVEHGKVKYYLGGYNDILTELGFDSSALPDRWLPSSFNDWSDRNKRMFLKGLWSANGGVIKGHRISLKSSCKPLILQLTEVLNEFGIDSYYTTNKAKYVAFSNGTYLCQESYDLNITRYKSVLKFAELIGFAHDYKQKALKELILIKAPKLITSHVNGVEDVYDFTLYDNTHWGVVEGVIVHNCGEQPMSDYDTCRLILLNLYSYIDNPFTSDAKINKNKLYEHAYEQARLLDDLVDLEIEYGKRIIDKINKDPEPDEEKAIELRLWENIIRIAESGRRTGGGITGLADALAALGINYGSKESFDAITDLMSTKMKAELDATIDLAILRGTFKGWDKDKEFIIFSGNEIWSGANDWYDYVFTQFPDQANKMIKYGRRNINFSTIAPAGSVSILTQTSSGCEPLFQPYYTRRKKINPSDVGTRTDYVDDLGDKWQEYFVLHPKFSEWAYINGYSKMDMTATQHKSWMQEKSKEDLDDIFKKSPWYRSCANDINWKDRVHTQGLLQRFVTSAISSTTNVPKDTTSETLYNIYMEAWKSGCKGITSYIEGSRSGVLVTEPSTPDFKYYDAVKRPKKIDGEAFLTKVKGEDYTVFVGLIDNKPYEVFAYKGNGITGDGQIVKKARGHYMFVSGDVEFEISDNLTDEQEAITRGYSWGLRHGGGIEFAVEQLNKTKGSLVGFTKALARVLKKYIPKDAVVSDKTCPSCGEDSLVYEEGCLVCKSCGYGKC